MKRLLAMIVVAGCLCSLQAAGNAAGMPRMQSLAWLVGGVWTADATKLGPGMQRIETRYQWSDNSSFIRFTTHFVMDKATLKNYDGNFYWNPETSSLAVWYTDAENAITQGPMKIEGDLWQIWFRGQDFEGKQADLRVNVTRKSNDLYRWTLEEKQGESWKPLASLDYRRLPGT